MGVKKIVLFISFCTCIIALCGCSDKSPTNLVRDTDSQLENYIHIKSVIIRDWQIDEKSFLHAEAGQKIDLNKYFVGSLAQQLRKEIANQEAISIYEEGNGDFKTAYNDVKFLSKTKAIVKGCDVGNDVLINVVSGSVLPGLNGASPYSPTRIVAVLIYKNHWWKIQSHQGVPGKC